MTADLKIGVLSKLPDSYAKWFYAPKKMEKKVL
jgi:hypothetical protein